jgi:hypothetical protein
MVGNDCDAYIYSFEKGVKKEEIELLILWALRSAEFYYSKTQVRLGFSYLIKGSECIIRGGSEVSVYIVRMFTGLLMQKIGEDKFRVRQVIRKEIAEKGKLKIIIQGGLKCLRLIFQKLKKRMTLHRCRKANTSAGCSK